LTSNFFINIKVFKIFILFYKRKIYKRKNLQILIKFVIINLRKLNIEIQGRDSGGKYYFYE